MTVSCPFLATRVQQLSSTCPSPLTCHPKFCYDPVKRKNAAAPVRREGERGKVHTTYSVEMLHVFSVSIRILQQVRPHECSKPGGGHI